MSTSIYDGTEIQTPPFSVCRCPRFIKMPFYRSLNKHITKSKRCLPLSQWLTSVFQGQPNDNGFFRNWNILYCTGVHTSQIYYS